MHQYLILVRLVKIPHLLLHAIDSALHGIVVSSFNLAYRYIKSFDIIIIPGHSPALSSFEYRSPSTALLSPQYSV